MSIELKSMSRKQLEKHLQDVKKALQAAQARERRQALKAAQNAAAEFGFSLGELTQDETPAKKAKKTKAPVAKAKSKPQFANPADHSQTWTGKGRQPNWFRAEVEKGTNPDSMRV